MKNWKLTIENDISFSSKTGEKIITDYYWIRADDAGLNNNVALVCKGDLSKEAMDLTVSRANLIAVAPELLEALEDARGWVVTHAMQTYSKVAQKTIDKIDEAIKKAKGES